MKRIISKRQSRVYVCCAVTMLALLITGPTASADGGVDCKTLPPLPGTPDQPSRLRASASFCAIDFDSDNTAICPKNWSTSAAALVYDLTGTEWQGRRAEFEREVCPRGTHARDAARGELAVFKHSMNFRDTSGTYAPAILLYDHLSRWLDATVRVPATAELRFDSDWYGRRVVEPGLALASQHASRKMLLAAWQPLARALADPGGRDGVEFMLNDGGTLWGAALLFTGRRYGPEINGTRASGWGSGQNYDFQHTAPFFALRSDKELSGAIREGIYSARSDPEMAQSLPADINPVQIGWWMLELLDIVVLDFLLGQQDRIGNIDYQWRWVWLEDSEPRSVPAASDTPPTDNALRLRTTWLNDNDAGIRSAYANYARRTGMITGLRHFNPDLYRRLKTLAADMAAQGPIYRAIAENYHLTGRELEAIVSRVAELDQTITADCQAGKYRFDLVPSVILGQAQPPAGVACE